MGAWSVRRNFDFCLADAPGARENLGLPAGALYSDELHLENDHGDHWSWEPARDMEMTRYRALLTAVGRNFR